jgi:hypothetical protein
MGSRITLRKVAGKNGHRTTVFARFGLLDLRPEAEVSSALRPDTPPSAAAAPRRSIRNDELDAGRPLRFVKRRLDKDEDDDTASASPLRARTLPGTELGRRWTDGPAC